jgi:thiol-disulfide isomerase/thioredoxin
MKDNGCVECWLGISESYRGLQMYDEAITAADRGLQLASDDSARARAHFQKGLALTRKVELISEDPDVPESEFLAVLNLKPSPPLPAAHYYLGLMLLKESKTGPALDQMKLYLQDEPQGEWASQARQIIDKKQIAANTSANSRTPLPSSKEEAPVYAIPDFSIRTMQGETLSKRNLSGKVVLLDFWATWCGPCRASLPQLREIHRRYARDARFVLLSISHDRDERTWSQFVEQSGMDWPQYFDRHAQLGRLFNITGLPTYLLVDQNGSIVMRFAGWSGRREALLEDQIDRSLEALPNGP